MFFSYVEFILQVMMDLKTTLDTLELKEYKSIYHILSWKLKRAYNSKLWSLYTAFLHNIKIFG